MRTMPRWPRAVPLAVAALALVAVAGACRPGPTSPGGQNAAPKGNESTASTADDVPLPLDDFRLTPEQEAQQRLAMLVLTGECMDRAGYTEMDNPSEYRLLVEMGRQNSIRESGITGNKGRYGLADPVAAATYGYHPPPLEVAPAPPWLDKSSFTPAKWAAHTQCTVEAAEALGLEAEAMGPGGDGPGAVSAGAVSVGPIGPGSDPVTAVTKSYSLYEEPAVRAAIAQWSACMHERGYSYDTPFEASNAFTSTGALTAPPTAEEIATAVADVACKEQTGYIPTLIDVETRLQNALIEQRIEELEAYKAANDATMRRVADVLARL